ncbi:MAG: 16S rRNA (cytosine(1402)-N(4))-methyltransferase RsmH [Armatimonadetes bacterium]|nr:16S rRNA (cytosine(1402)-N(4))-methyltransferase RsmH [Armatimonadota bacterium]
MSAPHSNDVGHVPVMLDEVLVWLAPRPGGVYVDATVGAGGHAEAILERIVPGGRLIGIDRDAQALAVAARRLARFAEAVILQHANYSAIRAVVADAGYGAVDGIVMDLGASSLQLETSDRGFSFTRPGPLDMRMDTTQPLRAADLVNELPEDTLAKIIWTFGEERWARRIARTIVRRRPLHTTDALAAAVGEAIPRRSWPRGIHPATRTFQALRIATNRELEHLEQALPDAVGTLRGGGRLCVITFHSLEDRIVKHSFLRLSRGCTCPPGSPTCTCGGSRLVRVLTRKPVTPSIDEVARNARARSAKLRVAERLGPDQVSSADELVTDASEAGQHSADSTLPSISPNAPPPAPGLRRARPRGPRPRLR